MVRCSRCGKPMGSAKICPSCGFGPSQSVLDTSMKSVARVTGEVIETGVKLTSKVVKEAKPVVKSAVAVGKKGLSKAKEETLKVAKSLKED